ncbi:MAG: UDP-2,3-diacylglucosamine diphosphatase [Proteobacteria bacterium]|nr:UDP-2,3-diacylglucosamine diphosphatase [Pseudomonadota bacterium]MBU2226350.1 UDP-2,3-diacylglucosamine diphosphatase [Pseudomonadota bacterium]MBU2260906.1 UDP-2,3-diacylglucosamine diphosphatase [Pseudomonadota bacterium]
MKTIFLSDAHLKGAQDGRCKKLLDFFDHLRDGVGTDGPGSGQPAEQLVIAGDLFDFWFERDEVIYPGFRPMVEGLALLNRSGIGVSLCEGNHDFFLAEHFSRRLGIAVYPEWMELDLDGRRVLVSHGDSVDVANRSYLALRRFLRSALVFKLQRMLPLAFLWRIAQFSSEMSKGMSRGAQDRLVEVMHRFALGKFMEGYDAVILGHCHKPVLRQESHGGRQKTFATLGDWIAHDSYLLCENGHFTLNRFLPRGYDSAK